MDTHEKAVFVTAKIYELRKTAKSLYSEKYDSVIQGYKDLLKEEGARSGTEVLNAAIDIAKSAPSNGVGIMLLMAAAADLIEQC